MDKRTKERLEREKLKNMIENAPKLKAFLEAEVEPKSSDDQSLVDLIKPCVEDMLEKERTRGLTAGFRTAMLTLPEKLEKFETLEAAIEFFEEEAQKSREIFGFEKGGEANG